MLQVRIGARPVRADQHKLSVPKAATSAALPLATQPERAAPVGGDPKSLTAEFEASDY
jgi:hypothetical protein